MEFLLTSVPWYMFGIFKSCAAFSLQLLSLIKSVGNQHVEFKNGKILNKSDVMKCEGPCVFISWHIQHSVSDRSFFPSPSMLPYTLPSRLWIRILTATEISCHLLTWFLTWTDDKLQLIIRHSYFHFIMFPFLMLLVDTFTSATATNCPFIFQKFPSFWRKPKWSE